MINSLEANIGDCCYFLVRFSKQIKFGTITHVVAEESAVEVMEALDSKFYVIWENNAAWEEKELKGQIWLQPHNYHRELPEAINEKKSNKRISTVHNRTPKKRKSRRTKKAN